MKLKLTKVVKTDKTTKGGNPIIEIETQCGKKGVGFDDKFLQLQLGEEAELDIQEKEYQGQTQYWFSIPKAQTGGKFPAKDWTYDKRRESLNAAIGSIKLTDQQVKSENIVALARKYYEYLNEK